MTGFDWNNYTGKLPWLRDRTIFMTVAGSRAYGTAIETSDRDYRGVAIAPPEYYLGIVKTFEQHESMGDRSGSNLHKTREQTGKEPDVVIYEFRKFVKLAAAGNPNVLEILFTDESDRSLPDGSSPWYAWSLLDMRNLFVTKRVRATFAGYATSQLRKIQNNTEHSIPGSARYERIQKYGYCTKNAMHLVRLLRMCREILETGQVNVKRKDADELLAIRFGGWSLDELVQYAADENEKLDAVCQKSYLPDQPDMKEIDRRTVVIMREALECL